MNFLVSRLDKGGFFIGETGRKTPSNIEKNVVESREKAAKTPSKPYRKGRKTLSKYAKNAVEPARPEPTNFDNGQNAP